MQASVKKTSKSESEGGGLANLANGRPADSRRTGWLAYQQLAPSRPGHPGVACGRCSAGNMSGLPIMGKRYSKSGAGLLKEIMVGFRPDPKTTSTTTDGASTSRLPWDSVPYTSPRIWR